jgi:putative endonuclease
MKNLSYTYILLCNDNTLYTGWTVNLENRINTHNKGKASKYTRARLPVQLVHFEIFENKIDSQKREYAIKQLTRKQKLKLIDSYNFTPYSY